MRCTEIHGLPSELSLELYGLMRSGSITSAKLHYSDLDRKGFAELKPKTDP